MSDTSLALFEQLGHSQLGFTLVVAVLLLQLLAAIFGMPARTRERTVDPAGENDPEPLPASDPVVSPG